MRFRTGSSLRITRLLSAVLLAACGSDGPAGPGGDPGGRSPRSAVLRIVSGDRQVDTIEAWPADLVLQIEDSTGAAPLRETLVLTTSLVQYGSDSIPALSVDGTPQDVLHMSIPSDSFAVPIRFGQHPAEATVVVAVPALSLVDTAHFTIRPGAPHTLRVDPGDTLLFAHEEYTLRPSLRDRRRNVLSDPIALEASGAVSLEDGVVRGERLGRGWITGRAGSAVDSAEVSVVPRARMAALWPAKDSGQLPKVVVIDLDGTNFHVLFEGLVSWQGLQPDLSPVDDRVVFSASPTNVGDERGGLYIARVGQPTLLILAPEAHGFDEVYGPRFSPDGSWVYFTAVPDHQIGEIWRIRPDGSGLGRVGPENEHDVIDSYPSFSPTGDRIVYLHNAQDTVDWNKKNNLRIWDLGAGHDTRTFDGRFEPQLPIWSPDGNEIAFVIAETRSGGQIHVLDIATGALRAISLPGVRYEAPLAWVPAEPYFVARPGLTWPGPVSPPLELVAIDTGERIPLATFIGQFSFPSLRPLP